METDQDQTWGGQAPTAPQMASPGNTAQPPQPPTFAQYVSQIRDVEVMGRAQERPAPADTPETAVLSAAGAGYAQAANGQGSAEAGYGMPSAHWGDGSTDTAVASEEPQWAFETAAPSATLAPHAYTGENLTAPQPMLGPVGNSRSSIIVFLLSLITGGLYSLSWHRRINREMEDFDPRMHVRPSRSAFALFVPWAAGWLVSLAGAARIIADAVGFTLPFNPHFSVQDAYFLLGGIVAIPYLSLLLPFSAVAITMTSERIRVVEDCTGIAPDKQLRPTGSALWLLFPVVGGPALMARMQRRLNAVWSRVAPPASLRYQ